MTWPCPSQIGFNLVIQQAAVLGVEVLGLGRKLHALEQSVLMREFDIQRLCG